MGTSSAEELGSISGNRWLDLSLSIIFACLFPVLRNLLGKYVYQPVGEWALFAASRTKKDDSGGKDSYEGRERLRKWHESCWKMTVYTILTALALAVSYGEPWFSDSRHFWLGCTRLPCDLYVSKGLLLFYCVEIGFYIQAIPFLCFIEVRRKDFAESFLHHVVTLGLMVYSYYLNFTRIGIMIMLLHDCCDVWLELAKLSRYCRRQDIATVFFALFTTSWFVARIYYFPKLIIRSVLVESLELAAVPHNIPHQPHYAIFSTALFILLALHVFWSYFILQILYKALKNKGEVGDTREEDD